MTIAELSDEACSLWIAAKLGWRWEESHSGSFWHHPLCVQPQGHKECGRSKLDMVDDPVMTLMLMREMKKQDMHFTLTVDPDYRSGTQIAEHKEIINDGDDWELSLQWGDSNCHHPKDYDPEDGHGYTSFILIGRLSRIVAEAFMLASGWKARSAQS